MVLNDEPLKTASLPLALTVFPFLGTQLNNITSFSKWTTLRGPSWEHHPNIEKKRGNGVQLPTGQVWVMWQFALNGSRLEKE